MHDHETQAGYDGWPLVDYRNAIRCALQDRQIVAFIGLAAALPLVATAWFAKEAPVLFAVVCIVALNVFGAIDWLKVNP